MRSRLRALRIAILVLTLHLFCPAPDSIAYAQEIRAFWVDGFSDGFKTPEQVDMLLKRLQTAHCNAVFAQMRKSGDAYYLSRYEPWAADDPQHFDALADLIQKAHACKPRIQVHAWINTCAVGKSHGNPHHIALAHPDWKSLSDKGEDYDNEATKIDPGNPDAADWTFRVYLDVVRHYDVDGIHFDFVRYGSTDGKGRWGYNPVSVARFNARYGRTGQPEWTDPLWKQWRRDQVTALVRKVYIMTQAVKPNVAASAATITWLDGPHGEKGMSARKYWDEKSAGMNRVFQDWRSWMEEGILDMNCQMSYYQEKNHPDWYRHWIEWGKQNQFKRWVVPSSGVWLNPIPDSLKQIEAIETPGKHGKKAAGVLLYSYSGTNAGPDGKEQQSDDFFAALAQPSNYGKPPFAKTTEYPAMPWKAKPAVGAIKGFVLTADGLRPVDGAKVTLLGGDRRTLLTDGTGFYGFVDVRPGKYGVRVEAKGYAAREEAANVTAGASMTRALFLGSAPVAPRTSLDIQDEREGTPVRFDSAEVVVGTDTMIDEIVVSDAALESGPPHRCRVQLGRPPLLPFQPGDVVALSGVIHRVDGETLIDADAVRLIDMKPVRALDGTDPSAITTITGSELRRDYVGTCVEIRGREARVLPDRVQFYSADVPIEVMLTGRKLPGVESPPCAIPAPRPDTRIAVCGVAIAYRREDGREGLRIYPISANALKTFPLTLADRLQPYLRWSWVPVLGAIFPVWRWRKRRLA